MLSPLSPTCILFKLKMSSLKTPTKKSANVKVADVSKTPNTMTNTTPPNAPLKRTKTLIPKSMLRDENVSYVDSRDMSATINERESTRSPVTVPDLEKGNEGPCQVRPIKKDISLLDEVVMGSNVTNDFSQNTYMTPEGAAATFAKVAAIEAGQKEFENSSQEEGLEFSTGLCNICKKPEGNAQHYNCSPPTPEDLHPVDLMAEAQKMKEERLKKKFTLNVNTEKKKPLGGRKGVNKLTGANSNKRKADEYRDGALMTRVAKQMTRVAKQQTGKLRKVTLDSLKKRKANLLKARQILFNSFCLPVYMPLERAFCNEHNGCNASNSDMKIAGIEEAVYRLLDYDEGLITNAKAKLADMEVHINAVQHEIDTLEDLINFGPNPNLSNSY